MTDAGRPQVDGIVAIDGLGAEVRVRRDRWGIPHLRAATQHDLFVAQGFVQAQDRLFQMDVWRRASQGRLAEVLGPSFIQRDIMTRRIQRREADRDLGAEWDNYGADARAIAAAFVTGVNAAVRQARRNVPEEFRLAGWLPELWRAEDLLNRTEAFTADGSALDDVLRARLAASIGAARLDRLWPSRVGPQAASVGDLDLDQDTSVVSDGLRRIGPPAVFSGLAGPVAAPTGAVARLSEEGAVASPLRPEPRPVGGSAAWAGVKNPKVAGGSGGGGQPSPLVSVSEVGRLTMPAARYLIHLSAPGWNVIGATAPWRPGVAIGHNERTAWAYVGAPVDGQDVFLERTNPLVPGQVRRQGAWVDAELRRDAVVVKGREEAIEYDSLHTSAGVIFALDSAHDLAYALKWLGTEPGTAPELGALTIDRAETPEAFEAAIRRWKAPAGDFIYADVSGRVALHRAGLVPVRQGMSGTRLAAAWGESGWSGWTFGRPGQDEPDRRTGVVQAGQHAARRITDLLGQLPAFDGEAFRRLQRDTRSPTADAIVPLLGRLRAERPAVEEARRRLLAWNRQMTASGAGAAEASIFGAWEDLLRRSLVARWAPAGLVDDVLAQLDVPLDRVLVTADDAWTGGPAARDRLLLEALARAVDLLESGKGSGVPSWGDRRAVTFVHPLAVTPAATARFNVGPVPMPGDADTVHSVATTKAGGTAGPSLRAVFDAGMWDRSTAALGPGQSEHVADRHYADLVDAWSSGDGIPLVYSAEAVAASTASTVTLVPR